MSVEEKKSISNKEKNFLLVYYQMTLHQYKTAYALDIWFGYKVTL